MIIDVHTHIFESLDVFQKSFLDNFRAHKRVQLGNEGYKNWEAVFEGRIETLIKDMDEAEVPQEGRILYITPTHYALLKNSTAAFKVRFLI